MSAVEEGQNNWGVRRPPQILNLSNVHRRDDEIEFLCKGLSFCPTPTPNIFECTRQLRLVYHFQNSNYVDNSIVKLQSTYTPLPNEKSQLE